MSLVNVPAAWRATYGTEFSILRPECLAFANGFNAGKAWERALVDKS